MELTASERKACKKPYLSIRLVAKVLGVDPRTAKEWAKQADVLVLIGGFHRVSRERMKVAFPEAYRELQESMYDADSDDML